MYNIELDFFSEILETQLKKTNVLNQSEIDFLNNLINHSPEILDNITVEIHNIVEDGKIDYHDIPQIILLLSNMYKNHIFGKVVEDVGVSNIVKFTIDTFLQSGILPLPNLELQIIQKLVDSSIDLLKMNTEVIKKEEECCFAFFRKSK